MREAVSQADLRERVDMTYKRIEETATTLRELQNQIERAINLLGEDALWTGSMNGGIWVWREGEGIALEIEPKTEYLF